MVIIGASCDSVFSIIIFLSEKRLQTRESFSLMGIS